MPRKKQQVIQYSVTKLRKLNLGRYGFSMKFGAWLVNGFSYNPASRSVQMPHFKAKGRRVPLVRTFGMQVVRLRDELDELIETHREELEAVYDRDQKDAGAESGGGNAGGGN